MHVKTVKQFSITKIFSGLLSVACFVTSLLEYVILVFRCISTIEAISYGYHMLRRLSWQSFCSTVNSSENVN
jgi:hypothetical protein